MIELLIFPPAFGQISSSPFCVKSAYQLSLSGLEWKRTDVGDPRKMPHGKVPVIYADGKMIADSDRIQDYLEAKGAVLNEGLSAVDIAHARAFMRMAEEHLYYHVVLDRWADDAVWPQVRETYFKAIPALLRNFIANGLRKKLLNGMHHQGLGRLSQQERLTRIEPDIQAIETQLGDKPFLFGDNPTAADTSVAPMLASAMGTPGNTPLKQLVSGNAKLANYVARVEATFV